MESNGRKENLRTLEPEIIPGDKGVLVLVILNYQRIPGTIFILSMTQSRTERGE